MTKIVLVLIKTTIKKKAREQKHALAKRKSYSSTNVSKKGGFMVFQKSWK